jgi:hypothetical protein
MNTASESQNKQNSPNNLQNTDNSILEGEIIESHPNELQNPIVDLDLIFLENSVIDPEVGNKPILLKLTPWGIGAIALFLFSNLLLTWSQLFLRETVEINNNSSEIAIIPETTPSEAIKPQITPNNLSTLSQSSSNPISVALTPQKVPQLPPPPPPSQPSLSERLLPPALRPKPVIIPVKQAIYPSKNTVVPVPVPSRPASLQPPQPIPVPPRANNTSINQPNAPELSKDDQLRNILRQQIIREEANQKPQPTFNQRVRQDMLDKKLRQIRAQEAEAEAKRAAANAQNGSNNSISPPPPPQVSRNTVIPPAPSAVPSSPSTKPQNVNQLVNQLESLNQK